MSRKRIGKKVREEAARICAMCASSMPQPVGGMESQEAIGASDDAFWLAYEAWTFAWERWRWEVINGHAVSAVADAEAEALLRTGWTP
jgi:hypothetical protein